MSVSALEFTQKLSAQPKSEQERAAILADPGFGNHFTDHTAVIDYRVTETGQGIWENARIEPYGPIAMDPAASVLHYGQEIFEGLKAYRHEDGSIWTFRPGSQRCPPERLGPPPCAAGAAGGTVPGIAAPACRGGPGLGSVR